MIRVLSVFLVCAGVALCAADFSGGWKGDVPRNGRHDDFSLTLKQDGQQVSGQFAFDRELRRPVAIERPELQGDELTFVIHVMDGQLIRFHVRPAGDKLAGEVTVGSEVRQIEIAPAIYQTGRGVSRPMLIRREDPKPSKVQGTVVLSVEVKANGRVDHIQVVKSLSPEADENAIECVKQWKFQPALQDGLPVTIAATLEVNFRKL